MSDFGDRAKRAVVVAGAILLCGAVVVITLAVVLTQVGGGSSHGGDPISLPPLRYTPSSLKPHQNILEEAPLAKLSQKQVNAVRDAIAPSGPAATNSVALTRVMYGTPRANGRPSRASALLCRPVKPKGTLYSDPLPVLVFFPGTRSDPRQSVANDEKIQILETKLCVYLASLRYAVVTPDYLGFGDSPPPHLYIHADTLASASRDALAAALGVMEDSRDAWNRRLFLVGYSEGGYAAMATLKLLETAHADVPVTGAAPMAGPFDLSGTFLNFVLRDRKLPRPYHIPLFLYSYNHVYHLWNRSSEIFQQPWAAHFDDWFTFERAIPTGRIPDTPSTFLREDVLVPLLVSKRGRLYEVLVANDL
eukprot:CAMPEP_0177643212 /NCGR_PEP_ID=MMETSP0447-20121125/8038_1 /TAXON_ID=0 /ORGANISM="Stygamoeba regulata, Strain BSH-02190019" /LENGTH=362 /DNA_ID=CAMNT_0019145499 /DNA_START=355 /DNA_END=1439 /DNA_ORIENTATION=-